MHCCIFSALLIQLLCHLFFVISDLACGSAAFILGQKHPFLGEKTSSSPHIELTKEKDLKKPQKNNQSTINLKTTPECM